MALRESIEVPCEADSKTGCASRWAQPFELLRRKWHELPAGGVRRSSKQLMDLGDEELLEHWTAIHKEATSGDAFDIRGWYHLLYKDILKGKQVMDVGSGLGIDGIIFAQHGAALTFVDIVESNLDVVRRLCGLLGLDNTRFCYLRDLGSLTELPHDFNVIWCQGSLINAPFDVVREERRRLLEHLPAGGRWIELAYPRSRWEREGTLPFDEWGNHTDGEGTPWMEWYDLRKLEAALDPARFDVVLHFDFHNGDFNWFDLVRTA